MMKPPSGVRGMIRFRRPWAFATGCVAMSIGVLAHMPMYLDARDMGYDLAGMDMSLPMYSGMALIIAGLALAIFALLPPAHEGLAPPTRLRVKALDDAKISKAHVGLLAVMAIAVTIDVMKPVTLGFVVPGMAVDYGLKAASNPTGSVPVAYLPLAGITGTVIGSFLWGWFGDRLGRRASILVAGLIFTVTSICGTMPDYRWNFVMCFIMGIGVGGMLPLTFVLMAEVIPARHRGWLMVLVGGDIAGAYIITSWLSSVLTPTYTWRILWLLGLPTGVLLLLLNRWIPESPRYLIQQGRTEEAAVVMSHYGVTIVEDDSAEVAGDDLVDSRWGELYSRPFWGLSTVMVMFGLGVGLVTFGFQLWIPSNLQKLGFTEVTAARILRDSAIFGLPLTGLVAWMYGFWSSKKTMVALGFLTAISLGALAIVGDSVVDNRTLLYALLVVPITGISSILAVLIAYASETFPTNIRSRGTGLAAAASKIGGVAIIAAVVSSIATPSIRDTAIIGAIPMVLGSIAVIIFGVETRRRSLEDITAEEMQLSPSPA